MHSEEGPPQPLSKHSSLDIHSGVRVQGLRGFKSLGFTGLGSDLSSKIYGFRRSGSRVGASRFVELGD